MSGRTIFLRVLGWLLTTAVIFGWLLLLESPHLGVHAALHWDAEASISHGPANLDRAKLAAARTRLYDILPVVRSTHPDVVTQYFWSPDGQKRQNRGLGTCRGYYCLVGDWIGHASIVVGRHFFGDPVRSILTYQLSAMLAVAAAVAGLLVWALVVTPAGRGRRVRWFVLAVATLSMASMPEMLSIARQWLTETPGFVFLVATVLMWRTAVDDKRRGTTAALWWAGFAGVAGFLTVRSRYTLLPVGLMLLTFAAVSAVDLRTLFEGRRWYGKLLAAFYGPVVVLVVADAYQYGPMLSPAVYSEVMVKSTRLFFHDHKPYESFLIALFVNGPMLIVASVGTWFGVDQTSRRPMAILTAVGMVLVTVVLLWRTAAQQVDYQPRHLFVFGAGLFVLMMMVLPNIRWRPVRLAAFLSLAGGVTVWNLASTFGPQRTNSIARVPRVTEVVDRQLEPIGAHPRSPLVAELWPAYFDWADTRRLNDTLTVWKAVTRESHPLLVVDAKAANANQFMVYVRDYKTLDAIRTTGPCDDSTVSAIRAAQATGRPVLMMTARSRRPPWDVSVIRSLDLREVDLCRVGPMPARIAYMDCGVNVSVEHDGITIRRARGTSAKFDDRYIFVPAAQAEQLTIDTDPERVVYHVGMPEAGRLTFSTWDPDQTGRRSSVEIDGRPVTDVAATADRGPSPVSVDISAGAHKVSFVHTAGGPVAVCEMVVASSR